MSVSGVGGPRIPPSIKSEATQRATTAAPAATAQRSAGHSQVSEFESDQPKRTEQNPLTAEENKQVGDWAKQMVDEANYSPEAGDRMKAEVTKRMTEFVKKNPDATPAQVAEEIQKAQSGAQADEMFNKNWMDQMVSKIQERAKEAMSSLFK
jgi:hypothetical protein